MTRIIELEAEQVDAAARQIGALLNAFNETAAGVQNRGRPLGLVLRGDDGAITGGLTARDLYSWMYVDLLFVPAALRGQGLGEKLLAQAETIAISRGCVGIWLDTFSFQARGFYERLGYFMFGELPDHPPGHSRYLMKKRLTDSF